MRSCPLQLGSFSQFLIPTNGLLPLKEPQKEQ